MSIVSTIALSEIKSLFREKIVYSITGVFICMALVSSVIGWATFTTVDSVYKASIVFIHGQGIVGTPANPFHPIPVLASFDNLIVYVTLIGTLLAIIIGHRSMMRERKSGILQIIFSRPVSKHKIVLGKVLGLEVVLGCIIVLTALVSIVSVWFLPLQSISVHDVTHLVFFFTLSFLYLSFFALLGLFFAIVTRSESLALFIPILIWVGVTFVLPELATGLTPTALLNPVTLLQIPPAEGIFSSIQSVISPLSIGWHYTTISGELLGSSFTDSHPVMDVLKDQSTKLFTLFFGIFTLLILSFKYLSNFNPQSDTINE